MLKMLYEHELLKDRFTCKVCGISRLYTSGCIVLVRKGLREGTLWTVCLELSCVRLGTIGQQGPPQLIRSDE